MAHAASTVLLCAIGDDVQLLALAILDDLGRNGSALNNRSANLDRTLLANSENLITLHFGVGLNVQLFDLADVPLLHAVLLTAGNNDCVHFVHSFSLYSLVVKAGPHRGHLRRPHQAARIV